MGTNYYWHVKPCPTCSHPENKYHIGKSSGGWSFSFQALEAYESPNGRPIVSAQNWREVFAETEGVIVDEYGDKHSQTEFWELVKHKKDGKNHCEEMKKDTRWAGLDESWCDNEGNSFTKGYFS
jgi:hypothetical protein